MERFLPYDPGFLPDKTAPAAGDRLVISVNGLPPIKTFGQSIRNAAHPRHASFLALRRAGIEAMAGRAWCFGSVELRLDLYSARREDDAGLQAYASGIMDALGGSTGRTFTFLPIVYQDDCQVTSIHSRWFLSAEERYVVEVRFG